MVSAGVVFAGITGLSCKSQKFALVNIGAIIIWLGVALLLLKEYRSLAKTAERQMAQAMDDDLDSVNSKEHRSFTGSLLRCLIQHYLNNATKAREKRYA